MKNEKIQVPVSSNCKITIKPLIGKLVISYDDGSIFSEIDTSSSNCEIQSIEKGEHTILISAYNSKDAKYKSNVKIEFFQNNQNVGTRQYSFECSGKEGDDAAGKTLFITAS